MHAANEGHFRRAEGNLTYLDFIRLLDKMWTDAHPDIPLVPQGGKDFASYPSITYGLDTRKPFQNEPKPRIREEVDQEENVLVVSAQRFQNIVAFSAVDENPTIANELIEVFEDFMLEFTPVFKRLGVSELVYARRLSDLEESRSGEGVAKRTVCYLLTTEKIIHSRIEKLNSVLIDARTFLECNVIAATPEDRATPEVHITDQQATPCE